MSPRLRSPHRLVLIFLAATLVPTVALVWLGWKFVRADSDLERQRVADALDAAASHVAAALERELSALDRRLPSFFEPDRAPAGDQAIAVRLTSGGIEATAGAALLFQPTPLQTADVEAAAAIWSAAEQLEFGGHAAGAIEAYRALARSAPLHQKAGALLRLARVQRKTGRIDEALATYTDITRLEGSRISRDPADLVARFARVDLLDRANRHAERRAEATGLSRDLTSATWRLDRTTYLAYLELLARWPDADAAPGATGLALAEAVASVFAQWRATPPGSLLDGPAGRLAIDESAVPLFVVWRRDGTSLLALVATTDTLTSALALPSSSSAALDVSLVDSRSERRVVGGEPSAAAAPLALKHSSQTGLPWTIRVAVRAGAPLALASTGSLRRQLLIAGLALLALLVPATGYLVARTVQRELALARQQASFVSAVSHEFRSPLTSLTHLTSLLRGQSQPTDARRQQYYDMLARETGRLRRFVETLLDFGRIEAGAARYRMTRVAPSPFVRQLADEFSREAAAGVHSISVTAADDLPDVMADPDALGRAVWNLLENAAKYSLDQAPISVRAETDGRRLVIHVIDQGQGIPPDEQARVFDQFFRGAAATASAVRGTGVGLAMVAHIVEAHGGEVRLESAPGRGSTFTILLPIVEAVADGSRRAS